MTTPASDGRRKETTISREWITNIGLRYSMVQVGGILTVIQSKGFSNQIFSTEEPHHVETVKQRTEINTGALSCSHNKVAREGICSHDRNKPSWLGCAKKKENFPNGRGFFHVFLRKSRRRCSGHFA